jgi:N-acetylglucosamine-6-phosphate deacetylase
MASLNPARALKIDGRKGSIVAGADADLVVLTPDLTVRETWVGGRVVN